MGCHYYWIRYIYILQRFVFSHENYLISSVLSVLSCFITRTCIAHTFYINGIQNKTHGRGPLINSHSHRHLTPPYIYSPRYIWVQGSTFLSFMLHVYIDIIEEKNVLACSCILILKISINRCSDISIEILLHSPRTWTLLTWPTKNMNCEINWQRHHVMDLLTCNQKIIVFILSHCQNSRLVQAVFQRLSAFYTVTRTVLLY